MTETTTTPGPLEWKHEHTDPLSPSSDFVPVHSAVIGGVLCRWWGEDEPEGVKTLNQIPTYDRLLTDCEAALLAIQNDRTSMAWQLAIVTSTLAAIDAMKAGA
ncbi:MAG TPA: hypothetical protein VF981_16625 [Gemmatimonadaceae bacterium]